MEVKPQRVAITTELPGRTSAYLVAEARPQVGGIIQNVLYGGLDSRRGMFFTRSTRQLIRRPTSAQRRAGQGGSGDQQPVRAERYQELVEIKAVSHQDYDDAVAALKQVEAVIEVGKAAVEIARINLAYTAITAPIRAHRQIVGHRGRPGDGRPGAALSTIQQLDPIYVDVTQSTAECCG